MRGDENKLWQGVRRLGEERGREGRRDEMRGEEVRGDENRLWQGVRRLGEEREGERVEVRWGQKLRDREGLGVCVCMYVCR